MEQCSFCGKTIDDVKRLIRSPIRKTTYICDACANLVVSIVSENDGKGKKEKAGSAHRWSGKGKKSPLRRNQQSYKAASGYEWPYQKIEYPHGGTKWNWKDIVG